MTATQPVEATGTKRGSSASMTATWPVEAPGTVRVATQPAEAPGAWTVTQPVEAPGARSGVQPTGSVDVSAVDQSLTSKRTVAAANTGVSDTEDKLDREPESPAVISDQEILSDRDPPKDDKFDQEFSEESNYRETMRGVRFFYGLVPDSRLLIARLLHGTTSLLPVPKPTLPGKDPSSYRLMTGCAES